MQIQRNHHGNLLANDLAHPGQQIAFGVIFTLGPHGAMQGEIDAINRAIDCGKGRAHGRQKLTG